MVTKVFQLCCGVFFACVMLLQAQQPSLLDQGEYYRLVTLETPPGVSLEVSGLAPLPDGKLAVAIRKGEVWVLDRPQAEPPTVANIGYHLFAEGMHEVLGLAYHEGDLYVTQRSEVTRLQDTDKDGKADAYLTASKGWGVSGAYHEYAYGPVFDRQGHMHNTLNCSMGKTWAGAGPEATHPLWRGWSVITPKGTHLAKGYSAGFRSPCGIGLNAEGDIFGTDQQGNWVPTSPIMHIREGAFFGHADALKDATREDSPVRPLEKIIEGITVAEAVKKVPGYCLPAVWLPYVKMGQSTTGLICDQTSGKFGPFSKQMFVGEFVLSGVNRVHLEKVRGQYQGACFPFVSGLQSAVLALNFLADGSMILGQSNRGWNSYGSQSFGLQRLVPTGKKPLEVEKLSATPTGFRFHFTEPVQATTDWSQTVGQSFTYTLTSKYGSPEINTQKLDLKEWKLSAEGLTLDVECKNLREGYVHEFTLPETVSTQGNALWHRYCAYTLNQIP